MPISLKNIYGGGSGGTGNGLLPDPPSKAEYNTAEFSAVLPGGSSNSPFGAVKTAYQFWDVRDVIAGHTFAINSGDVAGFTRSGVMLLRNDATGTTVWTKAYTALPWPGGANASEQACRLHAVSLDLAGGFSYVLGSNAGTFYLFKVVITSGSTTLVATLPSGFSAQNTTTEDNTVAVMRFTDGTATSVEIFGLGTSANTWRAMVVLLSNGSITTNVAVTPLTLFAGEAYSTKPCYNTTQQPYLSYVTRDKKTAALLFPKASAQGGFAVVVYRASGRTVAVATNTQAYQFPSTLQSFSARGHMMSTDSKFGMAYRASGTAAGVGDVYGAYDAYDMNDVDRWLTEIADDAGLPAGVALW